MCFIEYYQLNKSKFIKRNIFFSFIFPALLCVICYFTLYYVILLQCISYVVLLIAWQKQNIQFTILTFEKFS